MLRPLDDKFVIRKCRLLRLWQSEPHDWVVWLPEGQRWVQSPDGATSYTTQGLAVKNFEAGCRLVADRLRKCAEEARHA